MKKNILILAGILLSAGSVSAQYAEDALRFSQTEHGATARFRGLGNAQTALGGDISSLSSNPAGLGLFTRREFSFTPEFSNSTVNTQFLDKGSMSKKNKAALNHAGIVFNIPSVRYGKSDATKGLVSFNLGISYNKTNNFDATVDYNGNNSKSSFTDYLADISNGKLGNGNPATNSNALPAGSLEKMAYDNYLVEYTQDGYFSTTAVNPGSNNQRNLIYHTGSQSEINAGAAGNFNNQLYFGASISLTGLSYEADREFSETGKTRTFTGQQDAFVNANYDLTYQSNQQTTGSGISGKLGLIYRASKNLRIGASFFTPTFYSITDEYSEKIDTKYTPPNGSYIAPYTNDPTVYPNDYSLRTPYRVNGGLAFILNNMGLISADIEYVDYSFIKYQSDDNFTDTEMKKEIRETYQGAVNYRIGAELKVVPSIMLRAGYNIKGNPYQQLDYTSNTVTAGLGYKVNNLSLDITLSNLTHEYDSRPYKISASYPDLQFSGNGPTATIKNNMTNIFATIGYRF